MNTPAIRELIDQVKEKFGDDAYLELYTDGSGFVRYTTKYTEPDKLLAEFDGLGELSEILKPPTTLDRNRYYYTVSPWVKSRQDLVQEINMKNNLTLQHLSDQCKLIQNDLDCVLDGLDDTIISNVCQVIVDKFNILKSKFQS